MIATREQFDAVSESSPALACVEGHTSQTFRVTQVPAPLAGRETRPGRQELKALTARLCDVSSLRKYLAAGERDGTTGLAIAAYAPSREDWERGARAVRCDVFLLAKDGTPRTTTLDFRGALARPGSAALRLCYLQSSAGGVLSDDGIDVPCADPHTAEDISAWFNLDASLATPAERNARCLPYALQFLGAESGKLPAGVAVRPIIRTVDNARTVRCAVARAEDIPTAVAGTLSPLAGGPTNG